MSTKTLTSVWRGSESSREQVRREINARFGEEEAANYDPLTNCFSFLGWLQRGYRVRQGEKGIRMITYVEKKVDDEGGRKLYPKTIFLFSARQVEKIS